MPNYLQRIYSLSRFDKKYNNSGEPTQIVLRPPTLKDEKARSKYISKLKEGFSDFIVNGLKTSYADSNYRYLNNSADDKLNRLRYIISSKRGFMLFEVRLVLTSCNIKGYKSGILPEDFISEAHECVLHMIPSWSGEFDRLIDTLIKEYHLVPYMDNFNDLSLETLFSESKPQLISLMKKVNRDVFGNKGKIKINEKIDNIICYGPLLSYLSTSHLPPPENIILYCPSKIYPNSSDGFIGLLENGKFEIRVIVRREKFHYWDTNLNGIVEMLRTAINDWKTNILYISQEEQDQMENDQALQDIADSFRSEIDEFQDEFDKEVNSFRSEIDEDVDNQF
jgi:hypothetical protein